LPGQFFAQDRSRFPVWIGESQFMIAHIVSAPGEPHALEWVALFGLVLLFLIVEIPLVMSIFRDGSRELGPQATGK